MSIKPGEKLQTADAPAPSPGRSRFRYRAFGLAIHSDIPLAELEPDAAQRAEIDVLVRSAPDARLASPGPVAFEFSEDRQHLSWPTVGSFTILGRDVIEVNPAPDVRESVLSLPLLGPVMGLLLHLRGNLVLHASAIDVNGRGAVFLGDKGAGKSTTAGAFLAAGRRLLTDDVLAIQTHEAPFRILPAFPQLKLNGDAADALLLKNAVALPPPAENFPKRLQRLTGDFDHGEIPARAVYVLERGPEPAIHAMDATEALRSLMRFSFISRFPTRQMPGREATEFLRACASLAGAGQVRRLVAPDRLERLDELVRMVEADLTTPSGS